MGRVRDIPVTLPHPVLPASDWADAYQVVVSPPFRSAREASLAAIESFPDWFRPLLALRELVVFPFGLKHAGETAQHTDTIGIFPVYEDALHRLVAGLDDKHLDFRIVVDLDEVAGGQAVTLTTVITRHNMLGRTYLQLVLPFHRAIIRLALQRLAAERRKQKPGV
ncbi:MAG: DUF2867 domain-containing protein [Pseudomonadota bacterium]